MAQAIRRVLGSGHGLKLTGLISTTRETSCGCWAANVSAERAPIEMPTTVIERSSSRRHKAASRMLNSGTDGPAATGVRP